MGRDPSTWKHGGQQKQRSGSYIVDMSTRVQEELTTNTVSESCGTREGKSFLWREYVHERMIAVVLELTQRK